jgi:18S rRNA (guanine1575-N7)-methyltransferase
MSRPEAATSGSASAFYNPAEASSYSQSHRLRRVQLALGKRALELLQLPEGPCYLLDIGCGTGLSGAPLTRGGHFWVGTDISASMLEVAVKEQGGGSSRSSASSSSSSSSSSAGTADVLQSDMGHGLPFRENMFDGAVSISAIQWLCYPAKHHRRSPEHRLVAFFRGLRKQLRRGARAVLQFYPEAPSDAAMIRSAALSCGFSGGIVVDYPTDLAAKKYYLVIEQPRRPRYNAR